ncbi:MAG: GerMN domain-containing protein [Treponema sp.]|jgi:hypothetical protein|nr:GerMN domain-containing protein [Treponema sp.]
MTGPLIGLLLAGIFALGDFLYTGHVRRTFVFYFATDRSIMVEDRMLPRSGNREDDITRYVEEFLLGPESPDLAPPFPKETRLRSLLYRDGVVYAGLSESAALPLSEQGFPASREGVFEGFETLYQGILRNFPYVRDVSIFTGGNRAFADSLGRR